MNRIRHGLALAALAAAWMLLAGGPALAQGKKSDTVVKASATADKAGADGKQTVLVTLMIQSGWHIYANPVGNPDFDSTKTVVTIAGKAKLTSVNVTYPEGEVVRDKTVGDYKVYKGKVTIRATVQRASGDTGPLEAAIKLQSCSKSVCLLPATIKVPVN
jgi:DsbC/DsbD-like thiol-disulfide interchange protein